MWYNAGRRAAVAWMAADYFITRVEREIQRMADTNEPLGESELQQMKDKLDDLAKAEAIIDKAIRGGIDMSTQRAKARELRQQLTQLKNSFFPGR